MSSKELELMKAEVARRVLNSEDEELIKKMLKLLPTSDIKAKKKEIVECIPGLPYTKEERLESLRRAIEEEPSQSLNHEEFMKEVRSWL